MCSPVGPRSRLHAACDEAGRAAALAHFGDVIGEFSRMATARWWQLGAGRTAGAAGDRRGDAAAVDRPATG